MPAAASKQQRAERDLLLFLPDEILVVDGHSRRGEAWKVRYDFASAATSASTAGLPRDASKAPFRPAAESSSTPFRNRELPKGDYAKTVERAKEQFKVMRTWTCLSCDSLSSSSVRLAIYSKWCSASCSASRCDQTRNHRTSSTGIIFYLSSLSRPSHPALLTDS